MTDRILKAIALTTLCLLSAGLTAFATEHSHAGMKMEGMPMGGMSCPQGMMGMGAMSHAATTPAAGSKIETPIYCMASGRCCGR